MTVADANGAARRAITSSARLACGPLADAEAAIALRRAAEALLGCGVSELVVDLARVDDVEPGFVDTLAALTRLAHAHHCRLAVVGVESSALTAALEAAPLEDLFAIYAATRPPEPEPEGPPDPAVATEVPRPRPSVDAAPHEGRHAAGRPGRPARVGEDDVPRDRAG